MKTPSDISTILYQTALVAGIGALISGGVYKGKRPNGSHQEDLVTNSLPVNGEQFQRGTGNVNVYVPDVEVVVGEVKQFWPDNARIAELTDLLTPIYVEVYTPDYDFRIAGISVIEQPETNEHYINLRVDFNFFPTT